MRILFIHHRMPYPIRSGKDKVGYGLVRALSLEHQVTLIAPVDEHANPEGIEFLRGQVDKLVPVPVRNRADEIRKSRFLYLWRLFRLVFLRVPMYVTNHHYPEVARAVRQTCDIGHYDLVLADGETTTPYLDHAGSSITRVVGPFDDMVEAARVGMEVTDSLRKRLMWWLACRARIYYQPRVCQRSDWVFFHSELDMRRISELAGGLPQARVLPVPVGANEDFIQEQPEPNSLIFVGGFGPHFNQDAVEYFYREIFPLVLEEAPRAKFFVVGENPPEHIKNLQRTGTVVVTGAVPDVQPYLRRAAVYVAPIRAGTGLKTKIIEALSMGKAIVATRAAVQGLEDLGEDAIRIADDPEKFAQEVLALLRDDDLRTRLSSRARKLYENTYAFNVVAPRTLQVYAEIERWIKETKSKP